MTEQRLSLVAGLIFLGMLLAICLSGCELLNAALRGRAEPRPLTVDVQGVDTDHYRDCFNYGPTADCGGPDE